MKIPISILVFLVWAVTSLEGQPTTQSQVSVHASTPYAVVSQDGNSRVWQREEYESGPNGEIVTNIQSYKELASGLNYRDPNSTNSSWQPSKEEIDIQPDGTAEALQGQQKASFPANILSGVIRLTTPEGKQLSIQPAGLVYYDGTNTAFIAVLTNSIGQIVGNDQMLYSNAFSGINADLLLSYTKAGLEQDVILRERPPDPAALGLIPAATRLQILTEFISSPQPTVTGNNLTVQAGVELDDQELSFGVMRMIEGKAFALQNADITAVVSKSWMTSSSRQFLVEEVSLLALSAQLQTLSASAAKPGSALWAHKASRHLELPRRRFARLTTDKCQIAKADLLDKPGVVLDYQLINTSLTNVTFQGDTTYLIGGAVYLYGTTTFEGGSVLKYTNNGAISISGSAQKIVWKGGAYNPVVLTAVSDNTVGQSIVSGAPSGYYGNPMLSLGSSLPAPNLTGLRFCYAQTAVQSIFVGAEIYDAQFVGCQNALTIGGAALFVGNALFANTLTNIIFAQDGNAGANIQNSTFSASAYLATAPTSSQGITFTLTNCIVANVTNILAGSFLTTNGNCNGTYSSGYNSGLGFVTSASQYPFQAVGAGGYYLTSGSVFNAVGTTNIDPYLLADLATKTTYPPLLLSNILITASTTLAPQAQRDNNGTPALGYHYAPTDYLVDGCFVTNCALTLADGVVSACCNDGGFYIDNGGSITSVGSAIEPNIITSYQTVQEQPMELSLYGNGPGSAHEVLPWNCEAVLGLFNFTKFTRLADGGCHLYHDGNSYSYSNLLVQNCEFLGGVNDFNGGNGTTAVFDNNLFVRSTVQSRDSSDNYDSISFTNNLLWGVSSVNIRKYSSSTGSSIFAYNNDFDSCAITTNATNCINGYNAFLNCTGQLYPTNGTSIFSANSMNYQTSFLGTFYQPTNSPLIQKGSTTANVIGLYHFTTQTNQVPETNAIVDIGYHYVATDTNGIPLDSNGDGIPDYIEDANGNGLVDSGEIGWNFANDLGLQVIISQPANGSALP